MTPWLEAWAEIWEKSVTWDWDLGEARRICALRAPHVMGGGSDGKVSIERLCLSPYVESFVPELRSRKCFSCFGIPMLCYLWALWTLWTFCVPVWTFYDFFTHIHIRGCIFGPGNVTWRLLKFDKKHLKKAEGNIVYININIRSILQICL